MPVYNFSPFRCRLPRKPAGAAAEPAFFRCGKCGRLLHAYQHGPVPDCCTGAMIPVQPQPAPDGFAYEVTGGFDNNAVKAAWQGQAPVWIMLQTFTGVYLKFVAPKKNSPLVFPLADEDAYAYCGRDKCRKCIYNCKKGCNLYFYMPDGSLYILALDQTKYERA